MRTPSEQHPDPGAFVRMTRGTATPEESRAVVRHLLRGCKTCAEQAKPPKRCMTDVDAASEISVPRSAIHSDSQFWRLPCTSRETLVMYPQYRSH